MQNTETFVTKKNEIPSGSVFSTKIIGGGKYRFGIRFAIKIMVEDTQYFLNSFPFGLLFRDSLKIFVFRVKNFGTPTSRWRIPRVRGR